MPPVPEHDLLQALAQRDKTIAALQQDLAARDGRISELEAEIRILRQQVKALHHRIYGPKSEAFDPGQLDFFAKTPQQATTTEEVPPQAPEQETKPRKKAKPRQIRYPDDLPVHEIIIDPPEVLANPEAYRYINSVVSELLDYQVGQFRKVRTIRRTYVARDQVDAVPIVAPAPPTDRPGCKATPALLAAVVANRFIEHLPFYRQEQMFWHRHDVFIPRQTLCRWSGYVADAFGPIYKIMRADVRQSDYVQMDETPVRYLSPGNESAKQGYFWVMTRPGAEHIFHWSTSRGIESAEALLGPNFKGVLQSDSYAVYNALAKRNPGIILAGCMAHVRRKFFAASENSPQHALPLLEKFQQLYAIEARLREDRAGPETRAAMRDAESRPIAEELRRSLESQQDKHLPKSLMGTAIRHALEVWDKATMFLKDGRVEIDNNLTENAIRPTAIGKKNWLFIGAAEAGEKSAILYTITASCRRLQINAEAYIRDVLTKLPVASMKDIRTLTPAGWKKAQNQAAPSATPSTAA